MLERTQLPKKQNKFSIRSQNKIINVIVTVFYRKKINKASANTRI